LALCAAALALSAGSAVRDFDIRRWRADADARGAVNAGSGLPVPLYFFGLGEQVVTITIR
jgi:hypothetical protein